MVDDSIRIETPRLILRLPRIDDFERYAELFLHPTAAQHIGGIDASDGADHFYLLTINPDDEPPTDERMHDAFMRMVHRDSNVPGGWFCHSGTVQAIEHTDRRKWFAIAQVRQDV